MVGLRKFSFKGLIVTSHIWSFFHKGWVLGKPYQVLNGKEKLALIARMMRFEQFPISNLNQTLLEMVTHVQKEVTKKKKFILINLLHRCRIAKFLEKNK